MRNIRIGSLLIFSIGLLAPASAKLENRIGTADRWYTFAQVDQGKSLFAIHCAECHGKSGESIPLWNRPGPDSQYPPPPLNGTGHTWHHELSLLRRIIREGGMNTGGRMPAFSEKLSSEEIDSVIASFQSFWSDDIYSKWNGSVYNSIQQPEIIRELLRELD